MNANKIIAIILSVITIVILAMIGFIYKTKSYSPFEKVSFEDKIAVEYCRPTKKGREIFGSLVPYEKIWRTGANEASTFSTTETLNFGGVKLQPGSYSLWTIPRKEHWEIILNSETGQWGVDMDGNANMNPSLEVLRVNADVIDPQMVFEMFTITLDPIKDGVNMVLVWDKTMVTVPLNIIN